MTNGERLFILAIIGALIGLLMIEHRRAVTRETAMLNPAPTEEPMASEPVNAPEHITYDAAPPLLSMLPVRGHA